MENLIKENVENIINEYIKHGRIRNYKIKKKLIDSIFKELNAAETDIDIMVRRIVINYFLNEAYFNHCAVEEENKNNAHLVIYGDIFGVLYHKAVIDFDEIEYGKKLIGELKRLYIDAFINK